MMEELPESTHSTSLQQHIQTLPVELSDLICEFVFTADQTLYYITRGTRPPWQLGSTSRLRHIYASSYFSSEAGFQFDSVATAAKWLAVLEPPYRRCLTRIFIDLRVAVPPRRTTNVPGIRYKLFQMQLGPDVARKAVVSFRVRGDGAEDLRWRTWQDAIDWKDTDSRPHRTTQTPTDSHHDVLECHASDLRSSSP
ncbi:hypothetical protein BAUCODRAFT_301609 [Baudoinia panamericana UAMH 10762]|uniref:Uncharacterized protein n=1 Tax=Baudoinia panamericana (strain UAMH 10762) TaxID=717646 RepID=M2LCL1_BAUPA|nr:uncharacterized protein BAUCODRAFT_301609 [Baudoinia panamericana UAMH 10762]EMC91697.1 hypothetical protein BAUCODRAFT_301609 [Baudoinia panamericana UAMH 10762]